MCACAGSTHSVSPARSSLAPIFVLTHVLLLSVCTLLVQNPGPALCVPVSKFFPFGLSEGDSMTERTDDGGSGKINLTAKFPFFGKPHNKIYVNNNGVISFFKELKTYRPEEFPLVDETPIIAPYWADVDISKSNGTVWYRETRDPSVLSEATVQIKDYHSAYKNFRAFWVFIATWEDVGFYGAIGEGLDRRNTFQAVLVLDVTGKLSFVILNYARIEWTTGSNSNGSQTTGLGGGPAQAGFNAGNKINAYEIEGARTPAIINLTQTSNTGVPGKWIFRIDSAEIETACSQSASGKIFFKPNYSSMLGGVSITIDGPCLNSSSSVQGRFETGADLCCFVEEGQATCIFPPVFDTGPINVLLNVDDRGWNYTGKFDIKNIMDVPTQIVRYNASSWVTGQKVKVFWLEPSLNLSTYIVEILEFRQQNKSTELYSVYNKSFESRYDGLYEIEMPPAASFSGMSIAVVRIMAPTLYCNGSGEAFYSDIFPVQFASQADSEKVCANWLLRQPQLPALDVKGICPCTLQQAEGDTAQYSVDSFCREESDSPLNCQYRSRSAKQCITPNNANGSSGTYVCCYDKESGELLNALEGNGGGTLERYSYRQRWTSDEPDLVPYFTYMQEDIAPYLHCCEFSSNRTLCDKFLQIRKPVGCKGYEPPAAAQAAGDPHIETLDRLNYTFNGLGEFILLRVNKTGTLVQVRTSQATDIAGKLQNATVFTAIAICANENSSLLEIRAEDGDLFSIYVNLEAYELTTNTSKLSGITVYKNQSQNGSVEFTVVLEQQGLSLLVEVTQEKLLNVMVIAGLQVKGQLEGLLGNFNGDRNDDLMASNGKLLSPDASMRDIHYEFGLSWEVAENESLFTKLASDLNPFGQDVSLSREPESYNPLFIDEMTSIRNDTDRLCGTNVQCRYDYEVTGKEAIAKSTLKFNDRFNKIIEETKPVTRCDYVSTIPNANRTLTGLRVGDSVTIECDDGYQTNGSETTLWCKSDGQWSNSLPSCVYITHLDPGGTSFPLKYIYIAIGAAAGGFVLVLVLAVVVRVVCKRRSKRWLDKKADQCSDYEQAIELPSIFPISDIPSPVFENSLFMSSLQKLSEKGSFHIPRPTYVDPNIYSEYF
ncbi:unnamed protein product [Lymnaea stagnalis]|uniref:Sushi domain-containing protein 2 n=1 Tax=Lymnaea stagnalis TaxID=6523 RepID=A0AAV2HUG0_LYMST